LEYLYLNIKCQSSGKLVGFFFESKIIQLLLLTIIIIMMMMMMMMMMMVMMPIMMILKMTVRTIRIIRIIGIERVITEMCYVCRAGGIVIFECVLRYILFKLQGYGARIKATKRTEACN
jgi:hypothetical protein